MNSRQTATLRSIYANPTPGHIRWKQIVSLLEAVGAELDETRSGSRVAIILNNRVSVVHRAAPGFRSRAAHNPGYSGYSEGVRNYSLAGEVTIMATMQYGHYVARIMLDEERGVLHGRVENMADVISFEGATVDELQREFEESVKLYLKVCKKRGIEPKRPYSGKFVVRLNPTLHREIAVAADRQGESINKWVERALEQAALG